MLPKAYDPQGTEDRIYDMWEKSGAFTADRESTKETFTISMPPPNATGQLHLGHAVMLALEDIFIRFQRMRGKEALWVPGTDHAAIATENVVIKMLQEKGMKDPRAKLGREKLVEEIKKFVAESRDTIRSQIRKMGSSCDWSRERYTMDDSLNRCVNEVFVKMYTNDIIYRGHRIVNWDPKLQTNVSDDEVAWEEQTSPFYTFQYGPFQIGTVRPETKFGDKYVVMHPDDERYKKYRHGETFECEWINGKITAAIIKDEAVDPEFGTGVMTITPWHTQVDFDIAERHNLDKEQIIDFDGNLLPIAGEFEGMPIEKARPKIVKKLEKKGLLVKIDEQYEHTVAMNSRGGGAIEPQVKLQWFINVNKKAVPWVGEQRSLKEVMQDVVRNGDITIIPKRFEKVYFHWIDNLRDWCISRQIWWGHRIPVWYRGDEVYCGVTPPEGSESKKKIIFARHGQSTGNRDHLAQGQDDPLTEKGIEHAKKLRDALKNRSISKIISSRSMRALDTAKLVADHFGLDVEIWDELNGYDFGEIAGTPEVKGKMNIERAVEAKQGESLEEYFARSNRAYEKIKSLQSSGDILIVSHRTNLSTIDVIRGGGGVDDILTARLKNEGADYGIWGEASLPESDSLGWEQDPDTLDTWFSSALWTWSTLVDPEVAKDYSLTLKEMLEKSPDYKHFHPTQVMETGYDIIFFWVARMILMTTYATGQIPFDTIYLHGMIRTRDGRKMSKSDPETMIDPLDIIPKYGADALRMSMIIGQSPGNDQKLFEEKIAGYRNFVNKLWNASRFVLLQCQEADIDPHMLPAKSAQTGETLADRALLWELQCLTENVSAGLEQYRLSEVGERLYSFTWDYFCDWHLELSKEQPNVPLLVGTLRTILTLLHPYCPFVTEELWSQVKPADAGMLITEDWPKMETPEEYKEASEDFQILIAVISSVRKLRSEYNVEPGKKIASVFVTKTHGDLLKEQEEHIKRLGNIEEVTIQSKSYDEQGSASAFTKHVEVHLPLEGLIDIKKERKRLTNEKAKLEAFLKGVQAKLGSDAFVKNAPEDVVTKEKQKEVDVKNKLEKVKGKLATLA